MVTPHKRLSVLDMVKTIGNSDKRLRWSEIAEVRERLASIGQNTNLINLSETKFEILSQEASFNLHLRNLLGGFINSKVISNLDRKNLFATLERVLQVSDAFLADLELCWLNDIFLIGVFDVLKKHEVNFDAYVKYCSTQKTTYLHMKKLRSEKNEFIVLLERWHNSPENYSKLGLDSFLDLPQTRMTSLAKTCSKASTLLEKNSKEYKVCQLVTKSYKKMADKCERAVSGKKVKIMRIFDQVFFGAAIKPISLASSSRELVKIDELTLLDLAGLHASKHPQRHLLLFNDLILITKKANKEERLEIIDYCYLVNLELKSTDDLLSLMKDSALINSHNKLLMIKLNQNYEKKTVIHLFACAHEVNCNEWQKLLAALIMKNMPKPEVPEPQFREELPEQLPLPNRTSQEQKLVEELMRRQKARKSDWPESQAALDSFVDDKLENVVEGREFHIPRPITGRPAVPRPLPSLPSEVPEVPAKNHKDVERVRAEEQANKAAVEATIKFDRVIEYPPGMTVFPLVSVPRPMIKSGEVTQRWHYEDRKYSEAKITCALTLFNDVLFVTSRKKGDSRNRVLTYGLRTLVDITKVKRSVHLPPKLATDRDGRFMMMIHFLENHRHQVETMVVSVDSASERDAWVATTPTPVLDTGGELVFDHWDRPLVMAIEAHRATSADQLQLSVNDKMHVSRRRADGWYEGERVSDGQTGSFPVSSTIEIDSTHKHAKEVRQKAKEEPSAQ